MDVRLVNHLCGGRWNDIADAAGQTLVNEGPLAEQFSGQHVACLESGRPQLHSTPWRRCCLTRVGVSESGLRSS